MFVLKSRTRIYNSSLHIKSKKGQNFPIKSKKGQNWPKMTIPADHARVKQGKVAPESMMQTKDEATVQKIHLCPYKQ